MVKKSYPYCVGAGLSPCTSAMTAPVDILSERLIAAYTNAEDPCEDKKGKYREFSTSKQKET